MRHSPQEPQPPASASGSSDLSARYRWNRHTKKGDETYARRNAERHSAQPEGPDATYRSKRNGGEHEERLAQILDRGIEQQQNDDERYRNHDEQALGGTLKILKLATII